MSTEELSRPTDPFTPGSPIPLLRGREPMSVDVLGQDLIAFLFTDGIIDVTRLDRDGGDPPPPVRVDYEPGTVGDMVLGPEGDRLYVGGTEGFRVYDLDDGRLVGELFPGFQVVTDPGHRVLAVSQLNGTVTLRDAATLGRLGPDISAPSNAFVGLTPDARTLSVIDANGGLQLYDVATQEPIGPVVDLGPGTFSALPDSSALLVQRDGAVVELALSPATWLEQACRAAGRNLTADSGPPMCGTSRATCPQWPAPSGDAG